MIERLQRAMQKIDKITPELQDQIADLIESGAPSFDTQRTDHFFGIWKGLDADDMLEELDRIRHATSPSPPLDQQLSWLDEGNEE